MSFEELLEKIKSDHATATTIDECGGISTTQTQSDKLGYDWKVFTVNDIEVRKDYIEQENPVGNSADNPIEYAEGVPLINNAYYRKDGKIYVWMEEWVEWAT